MIPIILFIIALAIVIVLLVAAARPNAFRTERSTSIKAPPERLFPLINNFKSWASWSPYEKMDPDMKRSFTGAASGAGAVYEWDGNKKVGSGRMEIIDQAAPSRVTIKLDFLKPFEAHNTAEFTLEPNGGTTRVTWATFGNTPFPAKLFGVFVNLDNLVGRDFETGLANLKTLAEQ